MGLELTRALTETEEEKNTETTSQSAQESETLENPMKENVLSSELLKSSCSCKIVIVNRTTHTLRLKMQRVIRGQFKIIPAHIVQPRSCSVCGTATTMLLPFVKGGTKGTLVYNVESDDLMMNPTELMISWNVPYLHKPRFAYRAPLNMNVEIMLRPEHTEHHASVEFRLTSRIDYDSAAEQFPSLSEHRLETMIVSTYFDRRELQELYRVFVRLTAPKFSLTKERFLQLLPEFNNPLIVQSLFSVFDEIEVIDNSVSFEEIVKALSIMCRGSLEEKAHLSFKIVDLDKNGVVHKNEVLQIYLELASVLQKLGFSVDDYGHPAQVVNNIFESEENRRMAAASVGTATHRPKKKKSKRFTSERHNVQHLPDLTTADAEVLSDRRDNLTREEFVARATFDADFAECFGLFDYFYRKIIQPIEHRIEKTMNPQYQGWLLKDYGSGFFQRLQRFLRGRQLRYFVVQGGFLAYFKHPTSYHPYNCVNLNAATIRPGDGIEFHLRTNVWSRTLYARNVEIKNRWMYTLRHNVGGVHRFHAFAPVRSHTLAKWLVNGHEYFTALYDTLSQARHRILITSWYFSPELYLKRGVPLRPEWRLDRLLCRKADEGVHVYILLWRNVQFVYDLRAEWVCHYMNELHPNIFALCHPSVQSTGMWSHHQKTVVVDEDTAFVGGIDLCFGRYDDSQYRVTDLNEEFFPGRDYQNASYKGEINGPGHVPVVDRTQLPRLPWHDIAVRIRGAVAGDVTTNFVQRWNHAIRTGAATTSKKKFHYLLPLSRSIVSLESRHSPTRSVQRTARHITRRLFNTHSHSPSLQSPQCESHDLKTNQPNNSENEASRMKEKEREERELKPNTSVERVASAVTATWGSRLVADHLREVTLDNAFLPSQHSGVHDVAVEHKFKKMDFEENTQFHLVSSDEVVGREQLIPIFVREVQHGPDHRTNAPSPPLPTATPLPTVLSECGASCVDSTTSGMQCQVLRSVAFWSAGVQQPEQSIYKATLYLIRNAKHFIYIENQYFISAISAHTPKNRILEALYHRISKAIEGHEVFRVIVVLPCYPAGDLMSTTTRYIIKLILRCVSHCEDSLLGRLQAAYPHVDLEDYISFYSLRNYGILNNKPVTEQVYVHAKLMIVDDRKVLIGSANINDRSLRGTRDSELCVLLEESESHLIPSQMANRPFKVSRFVHSLRLRLWRDYLGLTSDDESIKDPVSDAAYRGLWMARAHNNTKLYLSIFRTLPDNICCLSDIKKLRLTEIDPNFEEKLRQIRGFLVEFPKEFLKDDVVETSFLSPDNALPKLLFS